MYGDLRLIEAALNNRLKELDSLEVSGNWTADYKGEREILKRDLIDIMIKKEISFSQKLKVQWAKEGDANSKLFHSLLNARKSKNFISKIEWDNGEMLTTEEVTEIVHFFEGLFSYEAPIFRGFDGVQWEGIGTFLSSWFERPFIEEEVKDADFDCDGNKAPGPDGFSMALFQSQWDTVKPDIIKVFEEFHNSGIINGITNETYICLIPKKLNSCRVKDF